MKYTKLVVLALCTCLSSIAIAEPKQLEWEDLIPPSVPYGEIIGEGFTDEVNDTWRPEYDPNSYLLNRKLDGKLVKVPGFVVPLEVDTHGIHSFILVPYVGACLHTPPPPPNQLILVHTPAPWKSEDPWQPIWVTGELRAHMQTSEIAETGYAMSADGIENYEWD